MPAPRACRTCGATLDPDVRWCTSCFAPITEFAPRAPHDGYVGTPAPTARYSRWKGGPLSFGPVGRLLITLIVVLMGPWTVSFFSLIYAPIWLGLAAVVLKEVWRPERLESDAPPGASERFRARHPTLGHRLVGSRIAVAAGGVVLVAIAIVTARAGGAPFYMVAGLVAMGGLAAFIVWVAGV